jgi:hypothetical protein
MQCWISVKKNGDEVFGGAASSIKNIYTSIKNAPNYPKGFKNAKDGVKRINPDNLELLEQLRQIEPGEWKKVFRGGYVDGKKVTIHYFEHKNTGKVFDVKTKNYWSNASSH